MSKKEPDKNFARNGKKTGQGYVDLKSKTTLELRELLQRQNNILKNRSFISKLSDKGGKIMIFKSQIEKELKERDAMDVTCDLMSGLDISAVKSEDIEWNHGKVIKNVNEVMNQLDSDDDEVVDPLKLIATHSGTVHHAKTKKKVTIFDEPSLITNEDLKDIDDLKTNPYTDHLVEKYGKVEAKDRFKPNKLKPGSEKPPIISAKNIQKKLGEKWEVTEATPPIPIFGSAKVIELSESLQLLKTQADKLKEIERRQASERLLRNSEMKMGNELPTTNLNEYRITKESFEDINNHQSDDDDTEEEDKDKEGAVFYNIIDEDGAIIQ